MNLTLVRQCPNCSADLEEAQQYCGRCGQKTQLHRFNLVHIFHELFHAVTHADSGFLHLTKGLAVCPGHAAREYVLEGKRKKYFNPFTYLLIVLGITLLVYSVAHPYTRSHSSEAAAVQANSSAVNPQMKPYLERRQQVSAFFEKNSKVTLFFAIPIISLAFWLFFLRSGINYAEHLVANIFFAGFYMLFTALVLVPIMVVLHLKFLNTLQLAFQAVYLTIAYYQFMKYHRPVLYLRTALATVSGLLLWSAFSGGLVYLYIAFG
mgnify:CR=1 FL=1